MQINTKDLYREKANLVLQPKFSYKNIHQVPKFLKVKINRGLSDDIRNGVRLDDSISAFMNISGQKPVLVKSRNSIAAFKVREGMDIGLNVTLRKKKMFSFIDRFIHITLPRVSDFRGISTKGFDGRGNYTIGIKDQGIFVEVGSNTKLGQLSGMDITFVTSATNDEEALELMKFVGFPFAVEENL
jgi:large subunit ribosomal protein L5